MKLQTCFPLSLSLIHNSPQFNIRNHIFRNKSMTIRLTWCFRSTNRTPGQDADSPLPPLNERLAQLRPSRELLEFYRQKITQFDGEQEALLQMLEKYRGMSDDQVWLTGSLSLPGL